MNNILSSGQNIPLAERTDLHKSCKSLETLLNILNDYCEAATAIVALQKRLARALRDTAGLKITNEIAGNALNASANIFEALAEVDSKFAKIADKEYDTTSTEVKKWFKKLSKEEKLHDERIIGANAKIKQAGQNLEKKSKKKALDAQEEHARYVQLVSILGPEITQEKYNHALQTSQKHTITTYNVAASLSRIADAEWLRTCESVRRFAPTVGPLGEWRSLCEGRWLKSVPGDLVDLAEKGEDKLKLNTIQERIEPEDDEEEGSNQQQPEVECQQQQTQQNLNIAPLPPPIHRSEPNTPVVKDQSHTIKNDTREPTSTSSASTSSYEPSQRNLPDLQHRPPNTDCDGTSAPTERHNLLQAPPSPQQVRFQDESHSDSERENERMLVDPNTGSVRSLSAFPAPPTHFPLPPLPRGFSHQSQTGAKLNQEQTYASTARLSESPLPMEVEIQNGIQRKIDKETRTGLNTPLGDANRAPERQQTYPTLDHHHQHTPVSEPIYLRSSETLPDTSTHQERSNAAEEFLSREFGVLRKDSFDSNKVRTAPGGLGVGRDIGNGNGKGYQFPLASIPVSDQRRTPLERIDTGGSGTGSIVAAMKTRYVNAAISPASGSRSPPRTEVPKLHTSVTEIATKYQFPPASTIGTTAASSPQSSSANSNMDIRDHLDREQELGDRQSPRRLSLGPGGGTRSPPPLMARHLSSPPNPEPRQPISRFSVSSSATPAASSTIPVQREREREVEVGSPPENGNGIGSRWRKMEELAELGIRAKEKELKEREQEIMMRERELEKERENMIRDNGVRTGPSTSGSEHGYGHGVEGGDYINYQPQHSPGSPLQPRPRERRISLRFSRQKEPQTPQQQETHLPLPSQGQGRILPSSSNPNLRHQSHHSYSSQNLSQDYNTNSTSTTSNSGSGSGGGVYQNRSTPLSPSSNNNNNNNTLLLPPQISHQPQQQQQQQQEKKGGWIRRLSMPVGQAFSSLDSSKRNSNSNSPLIPSNTRQLGAGIVGGRALGLGMDERKNLSSSALALSSSTSSGSNGRYGYSNQGQSQNQNQREYNTGPGQHDHSDDHSDAGGRFGLGLGLGKRSLDASRSATNLNLGRK